MYQASSNFWTSAKLLITAEMWGFNWQFQDPPKDLKAWLQHAYPGRELHKGHQQEQIQPVQGHWETTADRPEGRGQAQYAKNLSFLGQPGVKQPCSCPSAACCGAEAPAFVSQHVGHPSVQDFTCVSQRTVKEGGGCKRESLLSSFPNPLLFLCSSDVCC